MTFRPVRIVADDGHVLGGRWFETAGGNNQVCVLIAAAAGVSQSFYATYAGYLAEQGFSVLTFDYRGMGESRDPEWRGVVPTMVEWGGRDLAAAIDWLVKERPRYGRVLIGHSFGAQALGLAWNNDELRGLLGIAAGSGYLGHWPLHLRLPLWLFHALLLPLAARTGVMRGLLLGMPPSVAQGWARWCRLDGYLTDAQAVDGQGLPLRTHFETFRGRVRLCILTDDRFAPEAAVAALGHYYRGTGTELVHITPADGGVSKLGHFGFFHPRVARALWQQTADWLLETGRLPQKVMIEV